MSQHLKIRKTKKKLRKAVKDNQKAIDKSEQMSEKLNLVEDQKTEKKYRKLIYHIFSLGAALATLLSTKSDFFKYSEQSGGIMSAVANMTNAQLCTAMIICMLIIFPVIYFVFIAKALRGFISDALIMILSIFIATMFSFVLPNPGTSAYLCAKILVFVIFAAAMMYAVGVALVWHSNSPSFDNYLALKKTYNAHLISGDYTPLEAKQARESLNQRFDHENRKAMLIKLPFIMILVIAAIYIFGTLAVKNPTEVFNCYLLVYSPYLIVQIMDTITNPCGQSQLVDPIFDTVNNMRVNSAEKKSRRAYIKKEASDKKLDKALDEYENVVILNGKKRKLPKFKY